MKNKKDFMFHFKDGPLLSCAAKKRGHKMMKDEEDVKNKICGSIISTFLVLSDSHRICNCCFFPKKKLFLLSNDIVSLCSHAIIFYVVLKIVDKRK